MANLETLIDLYIEANGELEFSEYQLGEAGEDEVDYWMEEVNHYRVNREEIRELVIEYDPTLEEIKEEPILREILTIK